MFSKLGFWVPKGVRGAAFVTLAGCLLGQGAASAATAIPIDRFMKMRCSTDGGDTVFEWHGEMYSQVPGERQRRLFSFVGMNIGRCVKEADGTWSLLSRELHYYLDPRTGKIVHRWLNPWTNEEVPVVHVANNPVQNGFPEAMPAEEAADRVVVNSDIPLTYPNPLAGQPEFQPYGSQPFYQAIEMFKFFAPRDQVMNDVAATAISDVSLSWTRMGTWLPWMKMGDRPGSIIYSAWGKRLPSLKALDPILAEEIQTRMPLYAQAPRCWQAARNETSWTYFKKNFQAYLAGDRFPVAAPAVADVCEAEESAPVPAAAR